MALFHLSRLILYFAFILFNIESKFIRIESISSEKYFVILDTGIYLFNNNFTNQTKIFSLESNFNNILYSD